jgi:hydrogenase maturation protein HypF
VGEQVFVSQHIGDLETEQAHHAFQRVAADLPRLYDTAPDVIAADLHPDYLSTKFALERRSPVQSETGAPPVIRVQHHIAHALSCLAENEVALPALGVAWDGTGLGTDGTIWGGEFFRVTADTVERVAHWRPFRLPGGDAAVKEPRRAALGLWHELANQASAPDDETLLHMQQSFVTAFSAAELAAGKTMLARGVNSPWCCSVGRLFDAVASLVGLRQQMRFEGQAAMELEFAAQDVVTDAKYAVGLAPAVPQSAIRNPQSAMVLDWAPMIAAIVADAQRGLAVGEISAKFHNTLAEAIVLVAQQTGCERVALSGGCFQNRYLLERTVHRLRTAGFQPYWHQRVPPNDGGIALGQVVAARREFAQRNAAVTPLLHPQDEPLSSPIAAPAATLKRAEARAPLAPSPSELISPITNHISP